MNVIKKGNVELKTIQKVQEAIRLSKQPQSASAISKLEMLNFISVVNALAYLKQEGKVKELETSSGTFWVVA
jgi:hypothetical protein